MQKQKSSAPKRDGVNRGSTLIDQIDPLGIVNADSTDCFTNPRFSPAGLKVVHSLLTYSAHNLDGTFCKVSKKTCPSHYFLHYYDF